MAPDPRVAVRLQLEPHRERVGRRGPRFLRLPDAPFNTPQALDVMPQLMRDDVGLREVARGPEALLQLVVEAEIDVDLLIPRAVERPARRLAHAARGGRRIPEQHQRRLLVLARQEARPGRLRVVEDERDELHEPVFVGRTGHGTGAGRLIGPTDRVGVHEGQEVAPGQQAEDQQHQHDADPHRPAAESPATLPATILDIFSRSARRPLHLRDFSRGLREFPHYGQPAPGLSPQKPRFSLTDEHVPGWSQACRLLAQPVS